MWFEVGVQLPSLVCGHPVVPTSFVEENILAPAELSWYPIALKCNGLFLDSQFNFIKLYVYAYASTLLPWLLVVSYETEK